jgi:hypothetical protein
MSNSHDPMSPLQPNNEVVAVDARRRLQVLRIVVGSLRENSGLWLMAVTGALLIFCFGFGAEWNWMRQLGTRVFGVQLTLSESWELGAITWSLLFGAFYYFTFPFLPKERINRVLLALLSLGTVALCGAAVYSLHQHSALHFRFVLAIGVLFCTIDFMLFWWHSGVRRKMFLETLWVADAPMVAGMLTLFCFQIYHSRHMITSEMQTFLAGAISFQLIVSNVVFILCQFGVLRKIWLGPEKSPVDATS